MRWIDTVYRGHRVTITINPNNTATLTIDGLHCNMNVTVDSEKFLMMTAEMEIDASIKRATTLDDYSEAG